MFENMVFKNRQDVCCFWQSGRGFQADGPACLNARPVCVSDDSIYRIYRYIVFDINISYRIVSSKRMSNFSIYRDIFDNIATFSADSSLRCVTGKKDHKWDEVMVS